MKTIATENFTNKRVLVRCDFNVPLDADKNITDDTRIRESLPTIKVLLEKGASIILMSHMGRPKGEGFEEKYSLQPVATYLEKLLGRKIIFSNDIFTEKTQELAKTLKSGDIMLLENLRFIKGETKGDEDFAKYLASLGDVYVNDAFGSAHRAHSSTAIIAKFFPNDKYFGLLMEHEITNLDKLLKSPKSPFTAIIGGAKVSSKIDVIESVSKIVDNIIIGGGMAYTFIKAMGGTVGNSLCEDDKVEYVKTLIEDMKKNGKCLLIPTDTVCADKFSNDANRIQVNSMEIPDSYMGMDLGEKSIEQFKNCISKSKTILWNGPLGVFEMNNFNKGTFEVGKAIAEATKNGAYSAVGGGDSVAAVNILGLADKMSYISTGGGAMLEYLEGKVLPGVAAILD